MQRLPALHAGMAAGALSFLAGPHFYSRRRGPTPGAVARRLAPHNGSRLPLADASACNACRRCMLAWPQAPFPFSRGPTFTHGAGAPPPALLLVDSLLTTAHGCRSLMPLHATPAGVACWHGRRRPFLSRGAPLLLTAPGPHPRRCCSSTRSSQRLTAAAR